MQNAIRLWQECGIHLVQSATSELRDSVSTSARTGSKRLHYRQVNTVYQSIIQDSRSFKPALLDLSTWWVVGLLKSQVMLVNDSACKCKHLHTLDIHLKNFKIILKYHKAPSASFSILQAFWNWWMHINACQVALFQSTTCKYCGCFFGVTMA